MNYLGHILKHIPCEDAKFTSPTVGDEYKAQKFVKFKLRCSRPVFKPLRARPFQMKGLFIAVCRASRWCTLAVIMEKNWH